LERARQEVSGEVRRLTWLLLYVLGQTVVSLLGQVAPMLEHFLHDLDDAFAQLPGALIATHRIQDDLEQGPFHRSLGCDGRSPWNGVVEDPG